MKVLLSGGGTGGHVYPAIAIANKIKEENPDCEILFVGTEKGIESEIVPKYGYELKTVTVQGFRRKIDLENVKRVFKLKIQHCTPYVIEGNNLDNLKLISHDLNDMFKK